jgi:hypothetical protein
MMNSSPNWARTLRFKKEARRFSISRRIVLRRIFENAKRRLDQIFRGADGTVGSCTAFALASNELAEEILLIDHLESVLKGQR